MRHSNTFLPTLREVPAEAVISSHVLMLRAACIRKLSNGLYIYLPFGLMAFRNLERIVREEMNNIGAMEIKPSVVVPAELWKESGRWQTMGDGLLKVKNRTNNDFVISPTAEEVFTNIIREEIFSYKQLPITLYQINTKYRDEIRPRYGVMRGREFTMKDAYSFHDNAQSLAETYNAMAKAYRKIFKRCGLQVIPVSADSGAMGGTASEEFMVESTIGDNTLLLCKCGFAANVEKASCKEDDAIPPASTYPLELQSTPNTKTILDLINLLKVNPRNILKTILYAYSVSGDKDGLEKNKFIAVCIRADLSINEIKLGNILKAINIRLATNSEIEEQTKSTLGYLGPIGLSDVDVLYDLSVISMSNIIVGGLKEGYHYVHAEISRDIHPKNVVDIRTVVAGDKCPNCGDPLYEKKGNELGHIFQLGYKYTQGMNVEFLDAQGKSQTPIMGCYGIGIDRTLASIIEEHHDDRGIIWPMSITPYQCALVPVKYVGEIKEKADIVYSQLSDSGISVLLDDRDERPGVKFKDADLLGIPIRLVLGEKMSPGQIEVKLRWETDTRMVDLDGLVPYLLNLINLELDKLR